ncbi:DUF1523 family protein, partial [Thioclava sp. BHET1]
HSVVRIVGVTTQRMEPGINAWFYSTADSGSAKTPGRDIKFIQTIRPNGKPLVFRNEDTGWGWPPYFKFNTFNLQTEASNLTSTSDTPKWVMITHYGWRIQFLTVFPNAIRITPVAGPDVTIIPWASIVILLALLIVLGLLWRIWRRFRNRRLDPFMGDLGDAWDRAEAEAGNRRAKLWQFWRRLIGRYR